MPPQLDWTGTGGTRGKPGRVGNEGGGSASGHSAKLEIRVGNKVSGPTSSLQTLLRVFLLFL